jgi:hypothetical protein
MKLVTNDLPPFEVLSSCVAWRGVAWRGVAWRGVAATLACELLPVALGDWRFVSSALHRGARAAADRRRDRHPANRAAHSILAVAILVRERVGAARVALALVGFAGAVLVAQPGSAGISPAALFAFASAVLIAARDLLGRDVPARIPVMVVTFVSNAMVMVVAGLMSPGLESWRPPAEWHSAFLGFAGLFVTLGHRGLLLAYRLGRTAAVAPFFYSFALWAVLSGIVVFGALPNALAL